MYWAGWPGGAVDVVVGNGTEPPAEDCDEDWADRFAARPHAVATATDSAPRRNVRRVGIGTEATDVPSQS
jgi:hypothetical protein